MAICTAGQCPERVEADSIPSIKALPSVNNIPSQLNSLACELILGLQVLLQSTGSLQVLWVGCFKTSLNGEVLQDLAELHTGQYKSFKEAFCSKVK